MTIITKGTIYQYFKERSQSSTIVCTDNSYWIPNPIWITLYKSLLSRIPMKYTEQWQCEEFAEVGYIFSRILYSLFPIGKCEAPAVGECYYLMDDSITEHAVNVIFNGSFMYFDPQSKDKEWISIKEDRITYVKF